VLSKEERKAYNTEFWWNIKKQFNRIPNAEGKFIQWLNYPTKVKDIFVRLKVDNKRAVISIDIQSTDEGIRDLILEQFEELRKVFEAEVTLPAIWDKAATNDAGKPIYQIRWELEGVSLYNPENEEQIMSFFKEVLVGFDSFYTEFGEIIKNLVS
jgi:hypothetical protein